MPGSYQKLLRDFNYTFPKELIAQNPASPRDSAKLLIFNRKSKKLKFDTFSNIGQYLPKNSVLVFNQTKVVPARLVVKKHTGGQAEILYLDHDEKYLKVIADRKLAVNSRLFLGQKLYFDVIKRLENFYFLKPSFRLKQIESVLNKYGKTPLPPYIKYSSLSETQKRKQYQSVFAKSGLSVAAPTASLHFTKRLIQKLKKRGIAVRYVTLNVNLGTFAPLTERQIKTGTLHLESYSISQPTSDFLNQAKKKGRPIIAVGTTVARTLESAAAKKSLKKLSGQTNLFIRPGYNFKFVDSLITNFHVPKSSLLMLAAAFMGRRALFNLYQKAITKNFRFFSFGDGMLII